MYIQAVEMRFLQAVPGYKLINQKKNNDQNVNARSQLNIYNLCSEIKEYRQKWIAHVQQQPSTHIARQELHYIATGWHNLAQSGARYMTRKVNCEGLGMALE